MSQEIVIRPQKGRQEQFLSNPADIVIYGGSAGGGKTYAVLLECLRHVGNPNFSAVVFRRTYPQISAPGGLWDASLRIFPYAGGKAKTTAKEWHFPSGAKVVFRHLKLEKDRLAWQGSEIPLIIFDELTHFTQDQFFYLLSRNRSTCGVRPYIRATTNPDESSWVADMVSRYLINQGDDEEIVGTADPAKAGTLQYFNRVDGHIIWSDRPSEDSKSFSFVPATIFDNPKLLEADPGYLSNLKALPRVDRMRLLGGNWRVKAAAGKIYKLEWFTLTGQTFQQLLSTPGRWCRFWDFASRIEQHRGDDPDWTAGALVFKPMDESLPAVIVDLICEQRSPSGVDQLIRQTTCIDPPQTQICWYQDPGQAGVYQTSKLMELLAGFNAMGVVDPLNKIQRAKPLSAALEVQDVLCLRGEWNRDFFNQMISFPDGKHDDMVDAVNGAYNYVIGLNLREFKTSQYRQ
jgi:predicted phage terminase large subunit-like protein